MSSGIDVGGTGGAHILFYLACKDRQVVSGDGPVLACLQDTVNDLLS